MWRRATHLSIAARSSGSHCDGASDILEVVSEAALLMAPRAVLNVPVVEDGATLAPPRGTPSHPARVSLALGMATPDGGRLPRRTPRSLPARTSSAGPLELCPSLTPILRLRRFEVRAPRLLHSAEVAFETRIWAPSFHSRARTATPLTPRLFRKPLAKMVRDIDVSCVSSSSPAVSVHHVSVTARAC